MLIVTVKNYINKNMVLQDVAANPFPAIKSIKTIEYLNSGFHFHNTNKSKPVLFEIPKENFKMLSLLFEGSRKDLHPAKWQGNGELIIELKNGKRINIDLYRTFAPPSAFKISGQYYRGGIDEQFIKLLLYPNEAASPNSDTATPGSE
jgi:hypothetical protein